MEITEVIFDLLKEMEPLDGENSRLALARFIYLLVLLWPQVGYEKRQIIEARIRESLDTLQTQQTKVDSIATSDYNLFIAAERRFVVEVIRNDLIKSRGFRYLDEWESYLLELHDKNVIHLIDVQSADENNTIVIYGIPETFSLLAEV